MRPCSAPAATLAAGGRGPAGVGAKCLNLNTGIIQLLAGPHITSDISLLGILQPRHTIISQPRHPQPMLTCKGPAVAAFTRPNVMTALPDRERLQMTSPESCLLRGEEKVNLLGSQDFCLSQVVRRPGSRGPFFVSSPRSIPNFLPPLDLTCHPRVRTAHERPGGSRAHWPRSARSPRGPAAAACARPGGAGPVAGGRGRDRQSGSSGPLRRPNSSPCHNGGGQASRVTYDYPKHLVA